MTTPRTLYELLGVAPDATPADIKSAYRRLVRQVHPDVGGSAAMFGLVTEAFETLSDPARRAVYNHSLRPTDTTTTSTPRADTSSSSAGSSTAGGHYSSTGPSGPSGSSGSSGAGSSGAAGGSSGRHRPSPGPAAADRPPLLTRRRGWAIAGFAAAVIAIPVTVHAVAGGGHHSAASDTTQDAGTDPGPGPVDPVTDNPPPVDPSIDPVADTNPIDDDDTTTTAPAPTCFDLAGVSASYVLSSADDSGVGTDYWPRVTIRNTGKLEATVTFDGKGKSYDPTFPDMPTEMTWGGDDGQITVRPGHTRTVELGKQFGEVLAVWTGGHIESVKLTATATNGDGTIDDDDDTISCPIHVTSH